MTEENQIQTTGPIGELISFEAVPLTPEEEAAAAAIQADNAMPLSSAESLPVEDMAAAANYAAAASKAETHTVLADLEAEIAKVREAGADMIAYPIHLIEHLVRLAKKEL